MVAETSLLRQLGQVFCVWKGLTAASFALKECALLHILRATEPATSSLPDVIVLVTISPRDQPARQTD